MSNAEIDQNAASFRDGFPPMLWALYQGNLQVGFTEKQAFQLTCVALTAIMQAKHDPDPPKEDNP